MRSAQRRPSRSMAAMSGRPVVEPRTGRPGAGVVLMPARVGDSVSVSETVRRSSTFRLSKHTTRRSHAPHPRRSTPPYEPGVAACLDRMMPPGRRRRSLLFRTFVRNLPMTEAMSGWGSYELGRELSACRCGTGRSSSTAPAPAAGASTSGASTSTFFAERVGLTAEQVTSLTHGGSDDAVLERRARPAPHRRRRRPPRPVGRRRRVVEQGLAAVLDDAEVLDLFMLCGWYHAISFTANGARVELEDGAPRFADIVGAASAPVR